MKVRDAGRVQLGRQRSPEFHNGANMRPYLRVANVFEDELRLDDVMEMHFDDADLARYQLHTGDILLNEGQSRELVGRPAMYRGELPGACFTNSLIRFQAAEHVESKFALHLFRHWMRDGSFQKNAQITTNIAHLGAGRFAEMDFPLPPLAEQRRIVAKVDDLLARSRRAKAALDAIPPLLEKLRQSVLAAAFRGDLTADWREENPDVEPADVLLARIRVERRKKWEEAELARMKAKGRTPGDERWKAMYVEPEPADASKLPELPVGWCWASAHDLIVDIEAGSSFKCDERPPELGEVGVLKVSAVTWGVYNERESKTCTDAARVAPNLFVRRGDFLFSRANTSELVGACVIASEVTKTIMLSDKILRFSLVDDTSEWLLWAFRSPLGRGQIEALSSGNQLSMRNIGQDRVREIRFPLPPRAEQQEILRLLAASERTRERLEANARDARRHLARHDRAVLAKAFRGELVPQDPNDEPAEAMLARLRGVADAAAGARPQAKRGRRPVTT